MFQNTLVEIIKRVEKLTQNKKSIIEIDITDIKEEIHEALFHINFTEGTIENQNFEELESLKVTSKEALGLCFLSFVITIRRELSYNSLWVRIADALMENEENNTFFIDNYMDNETDPTLYLSEAIAAAIQRFNLRDGYDTSKPTDTILLQMGILKNITNLSYWLTSKSKNSIVEILTDRTNENFSDTFFSGWKILQRYSNSLISREQSIKFLEHNVWFKDFDFDELLSASKKALHTVLITKEEIENNFYLQSVKYTDKKLQFILNADDFYILNLQEPIYDIYIDGIILSQIVKDETTDTYKLQTPLVIEDPKNYKIKIEIKDTHQKLHYQDEFILFDFNHDILIFDEDGKFYKDPNQKLDESKIYSLLIDSDFEVEADEDNIQEYFDGYVHLITNITKNSNLKVDDGDEYQFSLNFKDYIKTPSWINHLELYAISDYLSFNEPILYQLRYNKIAVSARQMDTLEEIEEDASIVRWSYTGGVVYDLDAIENFNYNMNLTYDILINRKNSLKIKVGDTIFTKQLNVTLLEKTIKPRYRTFFKDAADNIRYLKDTNKFTSEDIEDNQIIITSFHEDFIKQPELKTQILRDKANIYDKFEINKFFKLTNYPYYGEEISSVRKIYDDVRWHTLCSISMKGIVKSFDEKPSEITLHKNKCSSLSIITLDKNYKLATKQIEVISNKISIPSDLLGFCLVSNGNYVGSYFTTTPLDIETIFTSVEILKFLRISYYPFAEYFNETPYNINRAQQEKARNNKKKAKRLLRVCIKNEPSVFLKAFIDDEFILNDITLNLHFQNSTAIVEQILFAIEFDTEEAVKLIHEIILNRWQEKMIHLPMFLIYLLNQIKKDRYYDIFLDELSKDITTPTDVDEDFIIRMINALLSNHKIEKYEKINIKTVTQLENKDFYIKKAIEKLIEIENTPVEENEIL